MQSMAITWTILLFCNYGLQSNKWAGFVLNFKKRLSMHLKKDFWHCGMRLWFPAPILIWNSLAIPRTRYSISCYFCRNECFGHSMDVMTFSFSFRVFLLMIFFQRFGIYFGSERTTHIQCLLWLKSKILLHHFWNWFD